MTIETANFVFQLIGVGAVTVLTIIGFMTVCTAIAYSLGEAEKEEE